MNTPTIGLLSSTRRGGRQSNREGHGRIEEGWRVGRRKQEEGRREGGREGSGREGGNEGGREGMREGREVREGGRYPE